MLLFGHGDLLLTRVDSPSREALLPMVSLDLFAVEASWLLLT